MTQRPENLPQRIISGKSTENAQAQLASLDKISVNQRK